MLNCCDFSRCTLPGLRIRNTADLATVANFSSQMGTPRLLARPVENAPSSLLYCWPAGPTKVGATRRFLALFPSSLSDSLVAAVDSRLPRTLPEIDDVAL